MNIFNWDLGVSYLLITWTIGWYGWIERDERNLCVCSNVRWDSWKELAGEKKVSPATQTLDRWYSFFTHGLMFLTLDLGSGQSIVMIWKVWKRGEVGKWIRRTGGVPLQNLQFGTPTFEGGELMVLRFPSFHFSPWNLWKLHFIPWPKTFKSLQNKPFDLIFKNCFI